MNLKHQLRLYLKLRDLKASDLAKLAGVPKQSLSDWLGGVHPKNITQVKKVADTLSVSLDHLCFGDGVEGTARTIAARSKESLSSLLGTEWVSGKFELKIRRIED